MQNKSFIPSGTPSKSESLLPPDILLSLSAACLKAYSAVSVIKALYFLPFSIFSIYAFVTSVEENSLLFNPFESSAIDNDVISAIIPPP